MSMTGTFGAPKSKIVGGFHSRVADTYKSMPSVLGVRTEIDRPEQQQAAPTNSGGVVGAATNINDQTTSVNRPSVGTDTDYTDGIGGISQMGKAGTAEAQIKSDNRAAANEKAFNDRNQAGIQAGIDGSQKAFDELGGQQGVSLSPKMGANSSATWINANNGKYHDYDGMYGAQCVDLYNFYMTGFVGGRASTGTGVQYANQLWQNHDTSALVQVARNQTPQMGDIAIWSDAFNGVGGHVAIVAQDNKNGTIRVLNANATSKGPQGNTVMSNLSTGTLLGYLRPRKLM